jgi:hypothetical protein
MSHGIYHLFLFHDKNVYNKQLFETFFSDWLDYSTQHHVLLLDGFLSNKLPNAIWDF